MSAAAPVATARRDQLVLTTPSKAVSLNIDEQYHTAQITALFSFVERLIFETLKDQAISPVYVLKYYKTTYTKDEKVSSILFDLIDIRAGVHPHSDSFFTLNSQTAELAKIRRVFVNNMFFINRYLANEAYLVPARIIEFSHIQKVAGFQNEKTNSSVLANSNKSTDYYVWETLALTESNELYKQLNTWNTRSLQFESPRSAAYPFEYAVAENAEIDSPNKKRSPK